MQIRSVAKEVRKVVMAIGSKEAGRDSCCERGPLRGLRGLVGGGWRCFRATVRSMY